MKLSNVFIAAVLSGIGCVVSFSPNKVELNYTLNEAIKMGLIECRIVGLGGFSEKCIHLEIKNKTGSSYAISIPRGSLFYPSDPGQQTLISFENQLISLSPSKSSIEPINAFCSEHSDRSPTSSTTFTLGINKNPKFDSLFQFIQNKAIPIETQQAIVWAVSDNSPVANISQETKILRDLRSFLFKMTKQEEESGSYDLQTSINENGYIEQVRTQFKGFVTFHSDKAKWIHQEVYDANGRLKFKSEQAFEIPKGASDYSFVISLKNWKSGKYTIKLKAGYEVVESISLSV